MTDFEHRLTEALTSGADQAPEPDRLVAGARTRAKTRRRNRYAVVAGAVVVALAVPVGVLALNDDGGGSPDETPVATDTSNQDEPGWHTVEHEGAVVDLPGGWEQLDTSACEFEFARFGPSGSDPCTYDHDGLAFYGSATFDPMHGAGVLIEGKDGWAGYVYSGDWALWGQATDRDLLRTILATARQEGQEAPDLSAGWRIETYDGLTVDVPASWKKGGLSAWCLDESVPGWIERPSTPAPLIDCRAPVLRATASSSAAETRTTGSASDTDPSTPTAVGRAWPLRRTRQGSRRDSSRWSPPPRDSPS